MLGGGNMGDNTRALLDQIEGLNSSAFCCCSDQTSKILVPYHSLSFVTGTLLLGRLIWHLCQVFHCLLKMHLFQEARLDLSAILLVFYLPHT